jgi:hypothetical protein
MTDRFLDAVSNRRAPVATTQPPVSTATGQRIGLLDDGLVLRSGVMEKEGGFLGMWKKSVV